MEVSPPEVTSSYRRSRSSSYLQPSEKDSSLPDELQRETTSTSNLLLFSPLPLAIMPPQLEEGPSTSQPLQPSTLGLAGPSISVVSKSASTSGSLKEGTLNMPLSTPFARSIFLLDLRSFLVVVEEGNLEQMKAMKGDVDYIIQIGRL